MAKQRESSEVVRDRILTVATGLFAEHGVNGIGIRRIADEAGINHALIIRYFGSKDKLVAEILQREISKLATSYPPNPGYTPVQVLANLRKILLHALTSERDTMKLVVRFGLDGLPQESYIDGANERAANVLAKWIALQQSRQTDENLPDGRFVSMVVMGALFSLVSIGPWLLTSVGLPQEEFEKRMPDVVDTAIWMIARAIGLPPEAGMADGQGPQPSAPDPR